MPKFSKILILVFLVIFVSIGFVIPRFSYAQTEGTVYVCPDAESLEEINPRCQGKIILRLGEMVNGMTLITTSYEGKDYYLVLGFKNGGGAVNLPPTPNAGGPYQGDAGFPITFDASNSTDPNADPLQYRWDFENDGIWDTEWLSTSTANHIWNNDYEGVVKLEVNDGEFARTATTSVKVISPKTFKEESISELESFRDGEKKIDKKIDKIIWFINKSLNENLWLDASHLVFFEKWFEDFNEKEFEEMFDKPEWTGPKSGIVVFHYEKVAVRLMIDEIKSKKTPEKIGQVFEEVITKLVKADQLLAQVSLFDAKNTPIQNPKFKKIVDNQIEIAEKELQKAEQELTKNRLDKAIPKLAKSWLHSQLAIKLANSEVKPQT